MRGTCENRCEMQLVTVLYAIHTKTLNMLLICSLNNYHDRESCFYRQKMFLWCKWLWQQWRHFFLHISTDAPWYCSRICSEQGGQTQDHVRNYSLAVTWYGLLDLAHRDMIREADGLAMMSMWRFNIPRFWSGHHYKYMIIAHRLLIGIYITWKVEWCMEIVW